MLIDHHYPLRRNMRIRPGAYMRRPSAGQPLI